jgi:uncharacterized protein YjiS (DUF1127 family)
MQDFYGPRAGRVALPKRIRPAAPTARGAAVRRVARTGRAFAALIARWRARRQARRHLESWLTMDPRLLADIGLQRTDVHAAVYGGARLTDRGGRCVATAAKVVDVTRRTPLLRLVASDDLDAAA